VALNREFVHGELTGKRVGLIGCGHVGQRLLELLAPFRVDVRVYDPYLPEETIARLGLRRAGLEEVLRHAEILTVHVPLTPKTRGMISERELNLLRKGAILVNYCRGPVVDRAALVRKLEQRELLAGLDVFDPEPLPKDSPLRHCPTPSSPRTSPGMPRTPSPPTST
jgi:phosphoglycerate dehydrogenase-like enzyme